MRLTDAAVQRLKGERDKRVEFFDTAESGFALRIAGTPEKPKKSWVLLYRVKGEVPLEGKVRAPLHRLTIGPYPAHTLQEARAKAHEAKKLAERGIDPKKALEAAAAAAQRAAREVRIVASVVDEFMVRFMEKGKRPHSPRYIAETRRNFNNHVLPSWGARDIKTISRRDVVKLLDDIADGPGGTAANRTRAALSTMFNWALRRDLVESNPVAQTDPPGQEVRRERVLGNDEIVALWKAELGYPLGAFVRMLLATGQRRAEVAGMRWQDLDEEAKVWTIPQTMTKNRRPHAVPLSEAAQEIIAGCPRIGAYVFTTRGDRPISGFSKAKQRLTEALRGAGLGEALWRLHDVRRTVATGLGELGISRFVIAQILNHADPGVTAIYDRSSYLSEKRDALEAWSRQIEELIGRDNNVTKWRRGGE